MQKFILLWRYLGEALDDDNERIELLLALAFILALFIHHIYILLGLVLNLELFELVHVVEVEDEVLISNDKELVLNPHNLGHLVVLS